MSRMADRDRSCPACHSSDTSLIRRKAVVTSLWQCNCCQLRFRCPKESTGEAAKFYENEYNQSFTTTCPDDTTLNGLLTSQFGETEKDFTAYIRVLTALGLRHGDRILDFGSSWGYGSWQLQQAGFDTFSYEINRGRSIFAREKLGCNVITDLDQIRGSVNCMFSAHVIEHLPDPNILWNTADLVLAQDGCVVFFTPNGDPEYECVAGA